MVSACHDSTVNPMLFSNRKVMFWNVCVTIISSVTVSPNQRSTSATFSLICFSSPSSRARVCSIPVTVRLMSRSNTLRPLLVLLQLDLDEGVPRVGRDLDLKGPALEVHEVPLLDVALARHEQLRLHVLDLPEPVVGHGPGRR